MQLYVHKGMLGKCPGELVRGGMSGKNVQMGNVLDSFECRRNFILEIIRGESFAT